MNDFVSSSALYDCGRAPELGTTTCEHLSCQAPAAYLARSCSNHSGRKSFSELVAFEPGAWICGKRLCRFHAAAWCVEHGLGPLDHAFVFEWSTPGGGVERGDIADVARELLAVIERVPDALRHDWDHGADLADCHWLNVALLDISSWPRADGGLDADEIAPLMLDALIGEVAAQRRISAARSATAQPLKH